MADEAPVAAPVVENGVHAEEHHDVVEQVVDDTPGTKVFVGNLAYSVNDEGLRAFFHDVESHILTAQVIMRHTRNGPRSAGYGFVALEKPEAADTAVELLHGKELDGRSVIVEKAKPAEQKVKDRSERKTKRRPGRRGSKAVPGEVTEAEANGHVEKPETEGEKTAEGEVQKPKKKKKTARKNKPRKAHAAQEGEAENAAAEATTEEAAPATNGDAHPEDASAPKKKAPKPRRAPRPPRPAGEDPVGEPSKSMLFVANLNFNVDDAALAQIFTDAGVIVHSARVVRRRWGNPRKSKGYGFVDVGNEEEQKKAIEALAGKELEGGRAIAVKVAVNTAEAKEEAEDAPANATEQPAATDEVAAEAAPAL